jgi:hypothetical protein
MTVKWQHIENMFHAQFTCMFMINLHTIFNVTMPDALSVITNRELYSVLKTGLEALRRYSTHLSQSQWPGGLKH